MKYKRKQVRMNNNEKRLINLYRKEIGELFDIPKEEIDDSKDSISTSEKEKDNDDSDWITDNEEDEEAVNDKEEQDGFMVI